MNELISPEAIGQEFPQSQGGGERRRSSGRRIEDWKNILSPHISVRDVVRGLFRFRRRSVIFFVATMAVVTMGLIVAPRKYTSNARLFVRVGRESVTLDPTATTGAVVGMDVSREEEINSIIEVMSSEKIMGQACDKVGPVHPEGSMARERAIKKLRGDVDIWSPKKSSVIDVAAEASSPEKAQRIVQAVIDVYMDEHLRINSTPGSHKFFDEQALLLKDELDDAMVELRDAKSRVNIASLDGRRESLQKQMNTIESQILETESAASASRAKLDSMRESMATLPDSLVRHFAAPTAAANNMRRQLYELQAKEQELLAKYSESHPIAQAVRRQVRELEAILATEQPDREEAVDAAALAEQSTYDSLQAKSKALNRQAEQLRGELSELNRYEVEMRALERKVKVAEAKYLANVDNLEQTRVDQALKSDEISNINLIQPATLRNKPTSPRKGLTLLAALLIGGVGAVGVSVFSEFTDRSLRTPDDVEMCLRVPLLVSVPRVDTPDEIERYARTLLHKLGWPSGDNGNSRLVQTVGVTSCYRGEGVSSLAQQVARAAARTGRHKVLLVDANAANASIHTALRVPRIPGLTETLWGGPIESPALHPTSVHDNLWVLPAGDDKTADMGDRGERLANLLEHLKSHFQLIVFDLPAMGRNVESVDLLSQFDRVLMVAESERVKREVASRARQEWMRAGASLAGVVLNKREEHIPEWLYSKL